MFIKRGVGTITDVLKEEELSDEQKQSVKEATIKQEEKEITNDKKLGSSN